MSSVLIRNRLQEYQNLKKVHLYNYVRRSRTIEAASKRATKKHFNKELEYSELDFACIHEGKDGYKSTSTGKSPTNGKLLHRLLVPSYARIILF